MLHGQVEFFPFNIPGAVSGEKLIPPGPGDNNELWSVFCAWMDYRG